MAILGGKKKRADEANSIELAKRWLLQSGIQNLEKDSPTYGSFNAWFDDQNKTYAYAFSEITGYAITTLLYLDNLKSDKMLIERAELAADWLLSTAWDSKFGALQCRYDCQAGSFNGRVCSFDAGMCLTGFVDLYRKTRKTRYLDAAINLGNWLTERMQKKDGSFYARIDTRTGAFVENREKWSSQAGSYHAKISIGLLNLFDLTDDSKYKESADNICNWALHLQCPDGRFITNRQSGDTHLHPHCYSAEGLLVAGLVLGNERYIESAASAMHFVSSLQLPSGSVPRTYENGQASRDESVDILSQVLRLWLLLSRKHKTYASEQLLEKAIGHLMHFQSLEHDKHSLGGFIYGYTDEGVSVKHISSWGTMFAVQALGILLGRKEEVFDPFYFI